MVKNRLDRAIQSERNLKEQIDVLKGSLLLSRILFEEQIELPMISLSISYRIKYRLTFRTV